MRARVRTCLGHRIPLVGGCVDARALPGCRRALAAWEVRAVLRSLERVERALRRLGAF